MRNANPHHPGNFKKGNKVGGGRPKGSKNVVPADLKALVAQLGTTDSKLVMDAFIKGIKSDPPHSASYIKMALERNLGPVPKEPLDPTRMPMFIVLARALGYDPLAIPPDEAPAVVHKALAEGARVAEAKRVSSMPLPAPGSAAADSTDDLEIVS